MTSCIRLVQGKFNIIHLVETEINVHSHFIKIDIITETLFGLTTYK